MKEKTLEDGQMLLRYYEPYKWREVYLIGVNISSETGKIKKWEYEEI